MNSRKLSILDFGYFKPPQIQAVDTLNFTFDLVRQLEELGYHRYWMAEHYNDYCSWTNPEVLMAVIAGCTERLKIGAAGITIFYHNTYRVATAFKMLAALYPDRIDLGIARGAIPPHMQQILTGKRKLTKKVLQGHIGDLLSYFSDSFLYREQEEYIPLPPYGSSLPQCWLLGTSLSSARYAISLQTHFSLSTFHGSHSLEHYSEIIKRFKEEYFQQYDALPTFNVAVQCTCIEDPKSLKVFLDESNAANKNSENFRVFGNVNYCVDTLSGLYEAFGTDELVLYDHNRNINERREAVIALGESLLAKETVYGN